MDGRRVVKLDDTRQLMQYLVHSGFWKCFGIMSMRRTRAQIVLSEPGTWDLQVIQRLSDGCKRNCH